MITRRLAHQFLRKYSSLRIHRFSSSLFESGDDENKKASTDKNKSEGVAVKKLSDSVIKDLKRRELVREPVFDEEGNAFRAAAARLDELPKSASRRGSGRGRRQRRGGKFTDSDEDLIVGENCGDDVTRRSSAQRSELRRSRDQNAASREHLSRTFVGEKEKRDRDESFDAETRTFELKNTRKSEEADIEAKPRKTIRDGELLPFGSQEAENSIRETDEAFAFETAEDSEAGGERKSYDHIAPILGPSFNLASYVSRSHTLQEFVKLGVELHVWERNTEAAEAILTLDFERDVKPRIQFLIDAKIPPDALGRIFTKNPNVFQEDLENLQIRLNYLESKKFTPDMIARVVAGFPLVLSMPTVKVDEKLGFYQKVYRLTGDEVRTITTRMPKLLSLESTKFNHSQMVIREVCGFSREETKQLFLAYPKIWFLNANGLENRFSVVHNMMNIGHETIVRFPQCLLTRHWKIKERHLFLKTMGKAQYDPTKEHYVCLKDLVVGNDTDFCEKVAKTPVDRFNKFLATL